MIAIATKFVSRLLVVPRRLDEQLAYRSAEQAREAVRASTDARSVRDAVSDEVQRTSRRRSGVA